jgi:dTMP kinase
MLGSLVNRKPRGLLIAIEGGDRCGKTTQVNKLMNSKYGSGSSFVRFPQRASPLTGTAINRLLTTDVAHNTSPCVSHLLFTANRWESIADIHKKLVEGTDVIMDRYSHSGIAYSVAQGVDPSWALNAERGLPLPDLILYLALAPEVAAQRAGFGEERLETNKIQCAVVAQFDAWAATDSLRWRHIDASLSVEAVHDCIVAMICDAGYLREYDLENFE